MSDKRLFPPSTRRDALKTFANGFGLASFAALAGRPVGEVPLDEVGQVSSEDGHVVDPVRLELPEQDLEDRHIPDRHQRLGEARGERPERGRLATGQNDGSHHR